MQPAMRNSVLSMMMQVSGNRLQAPTLNELRVSKGKTSPKDCYISLPNYVPASYILEVSI